MYFNLRRYFRWRSIILSACPSQTACCLCLFFLFYSLAHLVAPISPPEKHVIASSVLPRSQKIQVYAKWRPDTCLSFCLKLWQNLFTCFEQYCSEFTFAWKKGHRYLEKMSYLSWFLCGIGKGFCLRAHSELTKEQSGQEDP